MKIYTKTGDGGETGLFGGKRVPKDNLRVTAYGDVDELNSVIGVVLATPPHDVESELLGEVQKDLFAIGGQLASPDPKKVAKALAKAVVPEGRVSAFEATIDRADTELGPITAFVLPAGTPKAAAFHVARTVCRRAERAVVALNREHAVDPVILVYLNRLSDLLFTLARLANRKAGVADRTW